MIHEYSGKMRRIENLPMTLNLISEQALLMLSIQLDMSLEILLSSLMHMIEELLIATKKYKYKKELIDVITPMDLVAHWYIVDDELLRLA